MTKYEIEDFCECIAELEITPLEGIGGFFTWCNKKEGVSRIWSKIDHMFGNVDWECRLVQQVP